MHERGWSTIVFSSSIERLRAERLQREAEERRRAAALLEQRNNKGKESGREVTDRERPYNSAYFPELARKRQRRDRESWRDEILKSWAGVSVLRRLKDRQTWASVEASFADVIVLIKLLRHILLPTEKVRGRVQLRFCPCRVLLIITSTRQMAASRGAQWKPSNMEPTTATVPSCCPKIKESKCYCDSVLCFGVFFGIYYYMFLLWNSKRGHLNNQP